ncbi:MAG: DUF5916 domain-containing protein [Gemmatimonadaceae bacterium]
MLLSTLLTATLAVAGQQPPATTRPSATITRVATPPRLEDFLTGEPRDGLVADAFLQREPKDLVPSTERTQAYVSYDAANLYIVLVCHAKDPSKVRARMNRREAILNDDFVGVFLDTFNDHQRAFMFLVSPLGIQLDGIITEGQDDDFSFDTIWQSRGELTSFGYVVWLAIPFKSLRFPPATGPRTWGIAFMRGIPVNSESAFWPGITRSKTSFTGQFAELHGLENVSPGRNIQLIPYGTFTGARFLDRDIPAYDSQADGRVGIDAKIVARDSMAIDLTLNPDFSQVESDEPQVTVNQRFEVFFPEKRPFFLENSGYFQTPVNLFFSRRIVDPQFGGRVTGKVGGWAVGALVLDDRAPGHNVEADDPLHDDRAVNAVVRARREFGDSSVGGLVTMRDFGSSFNRIASADARLRLNAKWFAQGQAAIADTKGLDRVHQQDAAYSANLNRNSRAFSYVLDYTDIGKDFRTALGFVPRTDIRQGTQFVAYRWYPKSGALTSIGPNSFVQSTWDHSGQLQDWTVRFPLELNFKAQSGMFFRRQQSMERFAGIDFREHENLVNGNTSYFRWMDVGFFTATGTRPNYYPPSGMLPFLANFWDAQLSLTFRPASGLRLDETYIYSHLGTRTDPRRTIFDNHIVRSKMNYQFTREFSLRVIVDYNGVLSDPSLVSLERTKHLAGDVLLTYLIHPGTAFYVGYTDGYDSVQLGSSGVVSINSPTTSTGRQFFVKTSYLFRF